MQARAELELRLLSDYERRFGQLVGAVQAHLLHRPNLPSRGAESCDTFATLGNHAPERMAIRTVWMHAIES